MRKTTRGRDIRHVTSERVVGFIVKPTMPGVKAGEYIPVIDPGYKSRDSGSWDAAVKKANDIAKEIPIINPLNGIEVNAMIITKTLKTSRPMRLRN